MPPTDYKQYYIENKSVILERSKNRYLESLALANGLILVRDIDNVEQTKTAKYKKEKELKIFFFQFYEQTRYIKSTIF